MPCHTGERKSLKAWGLKIDEQGYALFPEFKVVGPGRYVEMAEERCEYRYEI
jgi:hypothetical protein